MTAEQGASLSQQGLVGGVRRSLPPDTRTHTRRQGTHSQPQRPNCNVMEPMAWAAFFNTASKRTSLIRRTAAASLAAPGTETATQQGQRNWGYDKHTTHLTSAKRLHCLTFSYLALLCMVMLQRVERWSTIPVRRPRFGDPWIPSSPLR